MKQNSWPISTAKQGNYSVGALPQNFTLQWDQKLFRETSIGESSPVTVVKSNLTRNETSAAYVVTPESAGLQVNDLEWRMLFFCHWMIDRIPKEGLVELAESLVDMYWFYQGRQLISRPALPQSITMKAQVLGTVTQPAFQIEFDEE